MCAHTQSFDCSIRAIPHSLTQPSWARRTLADVTTAEIDAIVAPFADKKEELTVTKDPYVLCFLCLRCICICDSACVLTEYICASIFPFASYISPFLARLRYAEIFHETYNNWESLQKDTQTFIGGSVPVGRDWDRAATNERMPRAPKPGQTGNIGRAIGW